MPKPTKYPARLRATIGDLAGKREQAARHAASLAAAREERERRSAEERADPGLAERRRVAALRSLREAAVLLTMLGAR